MINKFIINEFFILGFKSGVNFIKFNKIKLIKYNKPILFK